MFFTSQNLVRSFSKPLSLVSVIWVVKADTRFWLDVLANGSVSTQPKIVSLPRRDPQKFVRVPLSNTDGKMSAPIRTSIWELSKNVRSARGMVGKSISASRGIG